MFMSLAQASPARATPMRHVRVQSVVATSDREPHARVSHIGGVNADGSYWLLRQSDAIAAIKHGRWRFYVENGRGRRIRLIVATRGGNEYLKAEADGVQPDLLLALADRPGAR
jgi:Protein of unknown function (DUF3892)